MDVLSIDRLPLCAASPKVPEAIATSIRPLDEYTVEALSARVRADVKGPGIDSAFVGQRTQFEVQLWDNVELSTDHLYAYATFETKETVFSIAAKGENRFTIAYTPTRPGNYTLAIDILTRLRQYPVLTERHSGILVTGEQRRTGPIIFLISKRPVSRKHLM